MSAATELVRAIVRSEETRVTASWGHPERRLALLEICRAVDSIVLSAKHQQDEIVELCRQGANKAISLFVDDSCKRQRTPLFPSNKQTFQWAHSALQQCGRIAACEKLLDYERAGLGEFSGHAENLRFDFTPKYVGLEALEVEEFEWLENSVFETRRPVRDLLDSAQPQVHAQMMPLVYRWCEHYIGYTGLPGVDAYFHQRGVLAAEGMTAQDPFDDAAKFGGLPFGFYKAAALTLIGWAIKHTHFAFLLAKRHPDLSLQNLVTVTADVKTLASSLASALDVTTQEASQALDVLEINSRNVKELCINGHAPPPLVRAASEQFIRPVSGCLIEPFQCMVRNLRANYRNDWDLHVNERETFFRNDLFDLFSHSWLTRIPKSVVLKRDGRNLTDIDALIVDQKNGVAGLFQLKWQDGFGHSMRERSAKMNNFHREADSWTDAVTSFLSNSTPTEVNRTLRLPKSSRPTECRLFVVGRYFAHFSGDASPDDRAAYGVWPQLIRLMRADPGAADPIRSLHSALAAGSPLKRKIKVASSSFTIGNSMITMNGIG